MGKLTGVLLLLLFAGPAFAGVTAVPEIDGTSAAIGIGILVGVLGLIKERNRRK